MPVLIEFEVSGFVKMTLLKKKKKNTYVVDICEEYRVFHSDMRETKALDGHLKLNFHP